MKESFPEYYYPASDEYAQLWAECQFVLDANVLLNIYRYSSVTRDQLLGILDRISDRVWVPHQAALEYQRDRLNVIGQQITPWDKIREHLKKAKGNIHGEIENISKHPFINRDELIWKVDDAFGSIETELEGTAREYLKLLHDDPLRRSLSSILDGKVGQRYTDERLQIIYREGKARYEANVPPGYEDKGKGEPGQYGDLILWYQVIDKATELRKPIILVTDDNKEDWWQKVRGQVIGPRPELVKEMLAKANVRFHAYLVEQFMGWARTYLKQPVTTEVIEEARQVRERTVEPVTLGELAQIRTEIGVIQAEIAKDEALRRSGTLPRWASEGLQRYSDEQKRLQFQIQMDEAMLERLPSTDPRRQDIYARLDADRARLRDLDYSDEIKNAFSSDMRLHAEIMDRLQRNRAMLEALVQIERELSERLGEGH